MNDYMPVPDGHGGVAGYLAFAPDGATLGLDLDGNVVSAHSPDGFELDPRDYEVVDDDPLGIGDRLEALEQRVAGEPDHYGYEEPEAEVVDPLAEFGMTIDELDAQLDQAGVAWESADAEPEGEPDPALADLAEEIGAQLDREAERRGAPFSRAETLAILEAWEESGRERPIRDVVFDVAVDGPAAPDLDSRQGRVDFMVSRLEDAERDQRGQPLDAPDAGIAEADLDNRDERQAWMADQLAGRQVGPAYFDA